MFCRMTNIEVWNSRKYKIMLKIFCKVLLLFFIILTFIISPSKLCCSSFCKQWMFVICRMTNGPWRWIWCAGSVTITMNDIWPHFNQSLGVVVVGHMTVNFVHVLVQVYLSSACVTGLGDTVSVIFVVCCLSYAMIFVLYLHLTGTVLVLAVMRPQALYTATNV